MFNGFLIRDEFISQYRVTVLKQKVFFIFFFKKNIPSFAIYIHSWFDGLKLPRAELVSKDSANSSYFYRELMEYKIPTTTRLFINYHSLSTLWCWFDIHSSKTTLLFCQLIILVVALAFYPCQERKKNLFHKLKCIIYRYIQLS